MNLRFVPLRAAIEDTVYRGARSGRRLAADSEESWEELRFDAEAFRDAGVRVVAIRQLSARARGTGAEVTARLAMLLEFKDERLSLRRGWCETCSEARRLL